MPLWPQLEEILRAYVFGSEAPPGRLLFPSLLTGKEAMLKELRKLLDGVAVRGGWKPGEICSKMWRHMFTAARLQTLDRGAPVSVYTVARELGHGGEAMVRRVVRAPGRCPPSCRGPGVPGEPLRRGAWGPIGAVSKLGFRDPFVTFFGTIQCRQAQEAKAPSPYLTMGL